MRITSVFKGNPQWSPDSERIRGHGSSIEVGLHPHRLGLGSYCVGSNSRKMLAKKIDAESRVAFGAFRIADLVSLQHQSGVKIAGLLLGKPIQVTFRRRTGHT